MNSADAPAPASPSVPAPTPATPTDAIAAMRAVAAILKAVRGLDPAVAREALALASETFAA